jgi:hypothetical protein
VEYLSIAIPLILLYAGLLFYSNKLPNGIATTFISGIVIALFILAGVMILIAIYQRVLLLWLNRKQNNQPPEEQNELMLNFLYPNSAKTVKEFMETDLTEEERESFLQRGKDIMVQRNFKKHLFVM